MERKTPFVTADWLAENFNDPDIVIADCRWYLNGPRPQEVFESGHIEGAVLVDLDTDMSAPPSEAGERPLPTPGAFAATMRRCGISNHSHVVAYDDDGGVIASRLWWMLDSFGVACSILKVGLQTWKGPLATGPARNVKPGTFSERPFPAARFATADDVANRGDGVILVDARAHERYNGTPGGNYPRYGHIPGAVNVYARGLFVDKEEPVFHGQDDLAGTFAEVGVIDQHQPIIAYCGSGVSACTDLLALCCLGFQNLRLYTGSFTEWSADDNRPIEV